jgi:serine/threonine-protein kinase
VRTGRQEIPGGLSLFNRVYSHVFSFSCQAKSVRYDGLLTQPTMEQIGRYKILDEIGRGAMGVVYRAQDPAIGRVVAIKTIRLIELADPSERSKLRDRLMREAQSAGILSHPGIVTIYDVAEEGDLNYIAMEYVDGPTLERTMLLEPPSGGLVLSVLTQTAAALDYAHKRGIVHRDIKPANIMLHERATAKITDFGVARIQSHQMTQAGSMVGTPNYMSPEQIQGKGVDGRSDQFSLAVIAYELFTGEKPFTAESIPALAFKIVQDDPPQVHRLNPTLDWPVDTVLKRALAKDPVDRYPTCSDFAFALENACRASRDWKPVAPGAVHSMPTLAAKAPPVPPQPRRPVVIPEIVERVAAPTPVEPVYEEDVEPPRALKWARNAALAAVILAGVLFALLQFLDNDSPVETTQVQSGGTPAETKANPSSSASQIEDLTQGQPAPGEQPTPSGQPAAAPEESASAETPSPPPAPQRAKAAPVSNLTLTRLVTNPPGAILAVDGNPSYSCTSPCSVELPRGRHTIAATLEGYRRTLKIFESPAEPEIFLNLDRTNGTLVVRSEPRGASILVDGEPWKEKTPALLTLPTGRHSIEVFNEGKRETHQVTIRESIITNLAVDLQD